MRTDHLIQSGGFATGAHNTMVDFSHGGQYGFGRDLVNWVADTPHVPQHTIFFLLETPAGFRYLEDPAKMTAALKNLIEVRAETFEGIDLQTTAEFGSRTFGRDGQNMEYLTRTQRAQPNPSITFPSTSGNGIPKYWQFYMHELMKNPETDVPNVVSRGRVTSTDWTADKYTFSVLAVEPDITMTQVVSSAIIFGMMPKSSGERTLRRAVAEANEQTSTTIEFTGIMETGDQIDAYAQTFLDRASRDTTDPNRRPSFLAGQNVRNGQADIEAIDRGFLEGMASTEQV